MRFEDFLEFGIQVVKMRQFGGIGAVSGGNGWAVAAKGRSGGAW